MKKTTSSNILYTHIVFVAIILFFQVWTTLSLSPVNYPDTETYELPVLELLSGAGVSVFVRPAGYPFFIGMVYKLFGINREFVIYAQQSLGVIAYFLHFFAFRYFIKETNAAVLAFIVGASGTLIFYERAVLADFLNYFALLLALLFFFRYYLKGERPLFLALSAFSALAAYLIRPNSLILLALTLSFIFLLLVFRQGERARMVKHMALYAVVFIASSVMAGLLTHAVTGRSAGHVGVGAPTLLSRVADHIDYSSGPHLEIKERYRVLRLQHQLDYGKDQFTADASAAYQLMTELDCPDSSKNIAEYLAAARSAEKFYGPHGLESYYFTIYDIFRLSQCEIGYIDAVFKEITVEALLHDPAGYAKSVVLSTWDYIRIPSADYSGVIGTQSSSGGSILLRAFALIGAVFSNPFVAGVLLFAVIAGGVFYFSTEDRSRREYYLAAFLVVYLAANYLSIAVFMNVLSPRYKLPAYWVQILLLFLFAGTALRRVLKRD